jgi:hypothetical protein
MNEFQGPPPPLRLYEPLPSRRSKIPWWLIIILFVGSIIMCSPCLSAFSTSTDTTSNQPIQIIRSSPTATQTHHVSVIIASPSPTLIPTPKPHRVIPTSTSIPAPILTKDPAPQKQIQQPQAPANPPPSVSQPEAPQGGRIGAICNDGARSFATGSGACSHHHGVNHWLYN